MKAIYSVIRSYKTVDYAGKEKTVQLVEFESENYQEARDFANQLEKKMNDKKTFRVFVDKNIRVKEKNLEVIDKMLELLAEFQNPEDPENINEYGWSDYKDTQLFLEELEAKIKTLYHKVD